MLPRKRALTLSNALSSSLCHVSTPGSLLSLLANGYRPIVTMIFASFVITSNSALSGNGNPTCLAMAQRSCERTPFHVTIFPFTYSVSPFVSQSALSRFSSANPSSINRVQKVRSASSPSTASSIAPRRTFAAAWSSFAVSIHQVGSLPSASNVEIWAGVFTFCGLHISRFS